MYKLMYFDKQAFRVQLLKINMVNSPPPPRPQKKKQKNKNMDKILDKANNS